MLHKVGSSSLQSLRGYDAQKSSGVLRGPRAPQYRARCHFRHGLSVDALRLSFAQPTLHTSSAELEAIDLASLSLGTLRACHQKLPRPPGGSKKYSLQFWT